MANPSPGAPLFSSVFASPPLEGAAPALGAPSATGSPFQASTFSFTPAATFGAKVKDDEDDEGEDGEGAGEGAADADETHAGEFKALIDLPEIEVKSLEEDEDVMFRMRGKLYVFVKEDIYGGEVRNNWWRDRGVGDVKILKHKVTGASRLLMRQDKTHKICLNHLIDPKTALTAQAGSEVSVNFTAADFAEGTVKTEKFALKFGAPDSLVAFKLAFEQAKVSNKAINATGMVAAKASASSSGDAVADKLASLKVASPPAFTPAPAASTKPSPAAAAAAAAAAPANSAAPAPAAAPAAASAPSGSDAEARLAAEFAIKQMAKGSLVKVASSKGTPVTATKYKMALHVKNAAGEVHAHVVTVLAAGDQMVLVDQKQTGLVE